MSGSFQSHDYVPGISGFKIDLKTGEFELNSCSLGSVSKAPERQMVSVEVASYSKYDLPKNAANLVQFMEAELQRVPDEYRHAAEFEEFDTSYGDEAFNARLFLSYSRLETEQELADRLEKAKVAGTRIGIKNGQMTVTHDGVARFKLDFTDQAELEQVKPFKVDGGKVHINEAFLADASITNSTYKKKRSGFYFPIPGVFVDADGRVCIKRDDAASDEGLDSKLAANWSLKMDLNSSGQHVAAGIGLGLPSQFVVSADRFAVNDRDATEILADIASKVGETELGRELKEQIEKLTLTQADQVKEIIRAELNPGGLLHRTR